MNQVVHQTVHQTPLVVVGGWGVDAAMILPLFDGWPGEIHLVSLNEPLMTRWHSVADVAAYLLGRYPCPAVWVGWSQGAQVVMAAAAQSGLQVSRVITLAGFPRFVAAPDWPVGMAAKTFDDFRAGIARETSLAWRRFQYLLIHGGDDHRGARQDIQPWLKQGAPMTPASLLRGLEWLEAEDQRGLWQEVPVPALHLQAEQDAVVRSWADFFAPADNSEVVPVTGMTHWPRGQTIDLCRDEIRRFVFGKGDEWQI